MLTLHSDISSITDANPFLGVQETHIGQIINRIKKMVRAYSATSLAFLGFEKAATELRPNIYKLKGWNSFPIFLIDALNLSLKFPPSDGSLKNAL